MTADTAQAVADFNRLHQVGHIVFVSRRGCHGPVITTGPAVLDRDGVAMVPIEPDQLFGDKVPLGFITLSAATADFDVFWAAVAGQEAAR